MKKILLTLAALMVVSSVTQAATGIFGSYIGINPNGGGNTWYGAEEWGNNITDFDGANLGSFNWFSGDTLTISAFQVHTFKNSGGNVLGAELQYRVYKTGDSPGSFNVISANFLADAPFTGAQGSTATGGGDQNWGRNPGSYANLLAGLSPLTLTNYTVEVYFRADTNEGDRFSNNGGANYKATFNLVPEPSSALLLGAAALGMTVFRRRRA